MSAGAISELLAMPAVQVARDANAQTSYNSGLAELRSGNSSLPPGLEISLRKVLGSNQSLSGSCENRHFLKKKKKVKVKVLYCILVNLSFPSVEVTFKGPRAILKHKCVQDPQSHFLP